MPSSEGQKPHQRRLRRFYIHQPLCQAKGRICLDMSQTHHLRDIIRLIAGDRCLVTDGQGWEAEAEVLDFSKDDCAKLAIIEIKRKVEARTNRLFLRAIPTLLQRGKTDLLIEKAQEFGVDEVLPVTSDRCEVKIPGEKIKKTVERWRRIAVEASKQSGTLRVLAVHEPVTFRQAIENLDDEDGLLIFHPSPGVLTFADWIEIYKKGNFRLKSINVFIGPEGGFTDNETDWILWRGKKKNAWIVNLGDVVLRADTAFISVLGTLRFLGIV